MGETAVVEMPFTVTINTAAQSQAVRVGSTILCPLVIHLQDMFQ